MQYRAEIDGLRALAVLPVLFFHAGFPGFSGGYVGVDVFFVISGYLITGILLKDMRANDGRFSILNFYERRARRILPALYFVIFCTIPAAWGVMMPSQFHDFCQSLVAVSAFGANILFYIKSGYFEPSGELNPMLHIWSLAVEEQFYFIFPLLMLLSFRWLKHTLVPLLLILGLLSFYYSQSLLISDPSASFFLLHGRAWELLVGASLNFLPSRDRRSGVITELFSLIGLGLVVGSMLCLEKESPFPGLLAMPVVIGTALIIHFANNFSFVGRMLALKPMVGVGLISYSLYLWHQPLFAIARLANTGEPPVYAFFLIIFLSLIFAYISWRFIETPFRNKNKLSSKMLLAVCSCAMLPVLAFGLYGHMTKGFAEVKYEQAGEGFRLFDERLQELKRERGRVWTDLLREGGLGYPKSQSIRKVLVVGDSRGEDLFVSLQLNQALYGGIQFRYQRFDENCFPHLAGGSYSTPSICSLESEAFVNRFRKSKPDLVLVCCGWRKGSAEKLKYLMRFLEDTSIVVFGSASFNEIDSQFYTIHQKGIERDAWAAFFSKNVHPRARESSDSIRELVALFDFKFVDTYEVFQLNQHTGGEQPIYNLVTEAGDPLIIDQTHLTVEGARRLGRVVFEQGWLSVAPTAEP